MSVYSIWESRFPADTAHEGISVTKAIWRDMLSFDGYVSHELIQDLDQPGHLIRGQPVDEPRSCRCSNELRVASERQACKRACERGSSPHGRRRPVNDAALVVALANARATRRPTHARRAAAHDALADAAGANALLEPFLDDPVNARELPRCGLCTAQSCRLSMRFSQAPRLHSRRSTRWQRASLSSRLWSETQTKGCVRLCVRSALRAPRRCSSP